MVGELKKLALPAANPYVEGMLGWIIRRGELTTKLEYRIEQDKLDAKNDILVGNLRVSPAKEADEVKKRIGLPLGLIVALIKDGDGNVHVTVPKTRWRAVNAPHLVALVRAGARFEKGKLVERPDESGGDQQVA